jgi:hypothetical protein
MTNFIRFTFIVFCAFLSSGFLFVPKVPIKKSSALFMPAYDNLSSTNWSHAGLADIGGIPNRTTQCGATVSPSGLIPPQANDDAALIQAAIDACTSGQVVQLAAGTFQISQTELIQVDKSVTLRGTGNCTQGGPAAESGGHGPYCQTVLQDYDGPWPFYLNGGNGVNNCGNTTATPPLGTTPTSTTCPGAGPAFFVGIGANEKAWTSCQENNAIVPTDCSTTPTNLSADAAFGDTSVHVVSATGFSVGQIVLIDEAAVEQSLANPLGPCGGCSGYIDPINQTASANTNSPTPVNQRTIFPDECGSQQGSDYWFCNQRITSELKLVTNISGTTITFDSPLTHAYRITGSHDARLYYPTQQNGVTPLPFIQQAGVENISIYRGNSPIAMDWCQNCWIKNVDAGYWIGGVLLHYSFRPQVTGSYIHDCVDCNNDGTEYPISIETATTEALVDNNIFFKGGKGMVGRNGVAAVVANNYAARHMYQIGAIGSWFLDQDINGTHEGGTHHFDMEGNYTSSCNGDNTHGGSNYHTFFRNWCVGMRDNFTDYTCGHPPGDTCNGSSSPSPVSDSGAGGYNGYGNGGAGQLIASARLMGAGPMTFNYWYSFVDNLMGKSGVTTVGNGWCYSAPHAAVGSSGMRDHCIWMRGWSGSENQAQNGSDPYLDGTNVGQQRIFTNGNWDYLTSSADSASGYNQSFPSSLYTNTKPAYFTSTNCLYPWPWVTAESGTKLPSPVNNGGNTCTASDGLPAKARWDAGTVFVQP